MLLNCGVGEEARDPWTARRSNQSILKEISPKYSLEGLMLKLKLQYFGHLVRRTDSLEKTLMLEKVEGRRKRGWQRMRWLDGITDSMDMSWINSGSCDGQGGLVCCSPWGRKVRHDWVTELNWSTSKPMNLPNYLHWTTPFHSQLIIRCFLFYFLCISCLYLLLLFSITQFFLLAKSNDDHVSSSTLM